MSDPISTIQVIRPTAKKVIVTCRHEPKDQISVERLKEDDEPPRIFFEAVNKAGAVTVCLDPKTSRAFVKEVAAMVGYDVVERAE